MLSLLTLLGDSSRGSGSGLPESGRVAPVESGFDALLALAAGQPGPPPPLPPATRDTASAGPEPAGRPTSDAAATGSGLPALPVQRQPAAGADAPPDSAQAVPPGTSAERAAAPGLEPVSMQAATPGQPQTKNPLGAAARGPATNVADQAHPSPAGNGKAGPQAGANGERHGGTEPAVVRLASPGDTDSASVRAFEGRGDRNAVAQVSAAPASLPASAGAPGAARQPAAPNPASTPFTVQTADTVDPDGGASTSRRDTHDGSPRPGLRDLTTATGADRTPVPTPSAATERAPVAAGAATLLQNLPGRAYRDGARHESDAAAGGLQRSGAGRTAAIAASADQGLLPESARVRQAAEVMRQWQARSVAAEMSSSDAAAGQSRHPTTTPAASPWNVPGVPAPTATAGAAVAADGAPLSLADSQAAAEQLVQRMLQGQARQTSSIRLQLSPAELGNLQVQLQRHGDRLDVSFTATHPAARELIEASLPNLRALLQDVGLQLADVDVRHESPGRDRGGAEAQQGGGQGGQKGDGTAGGRNARARSNAADTGEPAPANTGKSGADGAGQPRSGGIDAFA